MSYGVFYTAFVYILVFSSLNSFARKKPQLIDPELDTQEVEDPNRLFRRKPMAQFNIFLPGKDSGMMDSSFKHEYARLDRLPVDIYEQPTTPCGRLQLALLQIHAAHKDVPASISGHHGTESLQEHSLSVTRSLMNLASAANVTDPLLPIIGLGHDLDKLIAYYFDDGIWKKKGSHHHSSAAGLIRNLLEFESLSSDDQDTLSRVIHYYHSKSLPSDLTERQKRLIRLIRTADSGTTSAEQKTDSEPSTDNAVHEISDGLWEAIKTLDINQSKGGPRADGWTNNEIEWVAVQPQSLMTALAPLLSQEVQKKLKLDVIGDILEHPATSVIDSQLLEMNLLITEVGGVKPDGHLFGVKVGNYNWPAKLLSKSRIIDILGEDVVSLWGSSKYGIKVTSKPKSRT